MKKIILPSLLMGMSVLSIYSNEQPSQVIQQKFVAIRSVVTFLEFARTVRYLQCIYHDTNLFSNGVGSNSEINAALEAIENVLPLANRREELLDRLTNNLLNIK